MSQTSLDPTSHYQLIFDRALEGYQRKTGKDLAKEQLFHTLEGCTSPDAVLTILRKQIVVPGQSHSSNDKLTAWLIPTVNVISVFSATIGGAASAASQPAGAIFTGIAVLLSTVKSVSDSQDILLDIFTRIESFFKRLENHIDVHPTPGMTGAIVDVMVEVLDVLATLTKVIKQNPAKKFLKKLAGNKDIEDALKRLENVTMEESRMTGAETLKVVNGVKVMVQGLMDMVQQLQKGGSISVNDTGDRVINSIENTGQQTENHIDAVTVEGLEGICGRADVDEVRAVKEFVSRAIASDSLEKMTSPTTNDFGGLSPDELKQKLAEWLSPPDPSENYDIARRTQHKGTATWFIESTTFREWKQTGCLLWIQGNPGSGKSVLTSAIIQDIETSCKGGSAHLAYFFFDFKDAGKQDTCAFLSSVLIQLSSQTTSFFDILLDFYSTHQRGSKRPSDSALIECLEKMLEVPSRFLIYVVVDALDECPNTSGVRSSRENVLGLVEELVGLRFQVPNLRLCIASRPEVDIRKILEPLTSTSNCISLHDEDGQKKDIADYVTSVVYSDKQIVGWTEKDKELAVETLSERAGGKFRWISCQLDVLRRSHEPSLSRVLNELPETLDETYEWILQEIPENNRVHAHRLLQCLFVAARPLRMHELAEVLAIDFDADGEIPLLNEDWRRNDQEQAVLTACSSLIAIIDSRDSRMVQFSHHSVKEFLASDRLAATDSDTLRYHQILLEPAHTIMAQACVGVLLCLEQPINNETMRKFPLSDYAAKHFADHAEFGNVASQLTNAIDELLDEDKSHFSAWMSHISSSWWAEKYSGTFNASPLYHVADLGFRCLVQHLVLKHPQDVTIRGGIYGTPIHAALRRRHFQVCELLLRNCVDLDIRDSNGQTLLHVAVGNGLIEVVQLIIGRGADIDAQDSNGWSPLHQIINTYPQLDDSNLKIMRLLLDQGADVEAQDNDHVTPLCQAARNGLLAATQLLIERGATMDKTKTDKFGGTPLHYASSNGYPDVIQLLLEHGADIQVTDDEHNTPLHLAASQGKLAAAKLLIERGADVHAQGNKSETPLHQASQNGSSEIIRLLLEHDSDIHANNNEQNTALHLAIIHAHSAAAKLLVMRGALIHVRGNSGRTPLQFASYAGSPEIILLLLERGADLQATDGRKNTPLHLAADQGKFAAAQLLIDRGAIVHANNKLLETPLHQASRNGFLDTVRLLINHRADIQSKNYERDTPLHLAVIGGHSAVAELLVVRGAPIHVRGKLGRTPLQSASYAGSPDSMRLLLEHGADIQETDDKHNTPLHLAAGKGKLAAAQLLIERGANVHAQGNISETPLHQASRNGSSDVILLLLEHDAAIQAKNNEQNTPLHIAVINGNFEAAQLLIERGAIVHLPGNLGRTPLHDASYTGSLDIMQLLLEHEANIRATDDNNNTPLHLAASKGKLDAVRLLVESGANVHTQGYKRQTPLHQASRNGSPEIIHLLLEHDADIQVQNDERNTPLHLAAIYGKFMAAKLLVESGALIYVRGNSGRTPLQFASYSGSLDIIKLLLERRADIEATDDNHNTPLHLAVMEQRLEATRLLLDRGANVLAQNKARQTPKQMAVSKGNHDITDLLSTYVQSGRRM